MTKSNSGMKNFLAWTFILLFIIATDTLIYLASLLNFKEGSALIFVFSFYFFIYIVAVFYLAIAWRMLNTLFSPKPLPGEKIQVTYEVTIDEYEKMKVFMTNLKNHSDSAK